MLLSSEKKFSEEFEDFILKQDDLSDLTVQRLVHDHHEAMMAISPIKSCHALPLEALRQKEITFWTLWKGDHLCGCGALKEIDSRHGEIKSMRTKQAFLRQGVAQKILSHSLQEAKARGYQRVSIETGDSEPFLPALQLYLNNGFHYCEAFADYKPDPFNVFLTKTID
jgi:putative acetyltransferase